MNKFTRLLAPLALVASMIAPSIAHASAPADAAAPVAKHHTEGRVEQRTERRDAQRIERRDEPRHAHYRRVPVRTQPNLIVRPPMRVVPATRPVATPAVATIQHRDHGQHRAVGQTLEHTTRGTHAGNGSR